MLDGFTKLLVIGLLWALFGLMRGCLSCKTRRSLIGFTVVTVGLVEEGAVDDNAVVL